MRLDPGCRSIPLEYEPAFWSELLASVTPGDVVVDVGANVGLYAIAIARRVGRDVVDVREVAVGGERGEMPFLSDRQQLRFDPAGSARVSVVALDDELERLALLKIDVEGFECAMLDGARSLLADESRRPRRVFVEAHLARLPELGHTEEDVTRALLSAGYHVTELSFDGLLTRSYVADAPLLQG